MSHHQISGSEAFKREPHVLIRSVPTGSFRKRKARTAVAFVAGLMISAAAALLVVAAWTQGWLG